MGGKKSKSLLEEKLLKDEGIIGRSGFTPSHLKASIHPLFSHRHFCLPGRKDLPKSHYKAIEPAIMLASEWVTKRPYLDWWVKLCCGNREPIANETLDPCGGYCKLGDVQITDETVKKTQDLLRTMGETGRIGFTSSDIREFAGTGRACAHTPADPDARFQLHSNFIPFIWLNSNFLDFAKQIANRPTSDSADLIQRVHFLLAVTIVHELAHAVWLLLFGIEDPKNEPFYDEADEEIELGRSWERFMFGALPFTDPIAGIVIPRLGLYAATQEGKKAVYEAIPMRWISEWFQPARQQAPRLCFAKGLSTLCMERLMSMLVDDSLKENWHHCTEETSDKMDVCK